MADDEFGVTIAVIIAVLLAIALGLFVFLLRLAGCCCWARLVEAEDEKELEREALQNSGLLSDDRPVEVF